MTRYIGTYYIHGVQRGFFDRAVRTQTAAQAADRFALRVCRQIYGSRRNNGWTGPHEVKPGVYTSRLHPNNCWPGHEITIVVEEEARPLS